MVSASPENSFFDCGAKFHLLDENKGSRPFLHRGYSALLMAYPYSTNNPQFFKKPNMLGSQFLSV